MPTEKKIIYMRGFENGFNFGVLFSLIIALLVGFIIIIFNLLPSLKLWLLLFGQIQQYLKIL